MDRNEVVRRTLDAVSRTFGADTGRLRIRTNLHTRIDKTDRSLKQPRQRKLDTNLTASMSNNVAITSRQNLPKFYQLILTFMENTAKEWNAMKKSAKTAMKKSNWKK